MYKFSKASLKKLSTVDERLQKVVHLALTYSPVDFGVTSGLRTLAEQRRLVAIGASKTMNSRHVNGTAVDLTPWVNGAFDATTWDNFYLIAEAMQKASKELNIPIRWGGCWGWLGDECSPEDYVHNYVQKRKEKGKSAFIDGAHFDLG